jgi:tetratricopeptide (TPR) repeat protein
MVTAYRRGAHLPKDFRTIARPLFGDDPEHKLAQEELYTAWLDAEAVRQAGTTTRRREMIPSKLPDPPRRPDRPDRCFGRDTDIAELVTELLDAGSTALVLLGTGGIGKTTVASKVVHDAKIRSRYGDRFWLVDLKNAKTAGEMIAEIARALGFDPAQTRFAYTLERLRVRVPALLLLDNLETPWNEDRRGARDTLRQLASVNGLTLFATFRGNVQPDTPIWTCKRLARLGDDAARSAFLSHASSLAQDPLLNTFLSELHGLPLLIRLVALRAANRTNLRELWEQWQKLGIRLAYDADSAEERHTSLLHSVAFSWQSSRLRAPARRLFRLLGQLPAGISKEDRYALMKDDAGDAAEQLFALGLAEWREQERLDLLPPIRDVAWREYQPEDQDSALWWQHYLDLVTRQGALLRRADAKRAAARLTPELANIDAAITAAVASAQPELVGPAADGFRLVLYYTGLGNPTHLRQAAEACRASGKVGAAAQCFAALGDVEHNRNAPDVARSDFGSAIALARDGADQMAMAHSLRSLADVDCLQGRGDDARAGYQAALALYKSIGDERGKAHSLLGLADVDRLQGNGDDARAGHQAALALYESIGDERGKAHSLLGLADVDFSQGKGDDAHMGYKVALALYESLGDNRGKAQSLLGLAKLDRERGKRQDARAGYRAALALYEPLGDNLGRAHCLSGLGDLAEAEDRHIEACQFYGESEILYRSVHQKELASWIRRKRFTLGCCDWPLAQ